MRVWALADNVGRHEVVPGLTIVKIIFLREVQLSDSHGRNPNREQSGAPLLPHDVWMCCVLCVVCCVLCTVCCVLSVVCCVLCAVCCVLFVVCLTLVLFSEFHVPWEVDVASANSVMTVSVASVFLFAALRFRIIPEAS